MYWRQMKPFAYPGKGIHLHAQLTTLITTFSLVPFSQLFLRSRYTIVRYLVARDFTRFGAKRELKVDVSRTRLFQAFEPLGRRFDINTAPSALVKRLCHRVLVGVIGANIDVEALVNVL